MTRFVLRAPAVLAGALSLSLGIALTGAPATAAQAAPIPGELVLAAQARAVPRATQLLSAGVSGFLWAQEGDDRLLWTDYSTGTATALDQRLPAKLNYDVDTGYFRNHESASFETGWYGRGSDTVALYEGGNSPHVTLLDKTRAVAEVPIPAGHTYLGTFGGTVLTRTATTAQLWRDGTETPVTGLPDGSTELTVEDGDARSVVLHHKVTGDDAVWGHWSIVDLATGAATPLPDDDADGFRLSKDSVLRKRVGSYHLDVLDRDDLTGGTRILDTGSFGYDAAYGFAGSTVLGVERIQPGNNIYRGQPLWTVAGEDDDTIQVMELAAYGIIQAPDGSILAAGADHGVTEGDVDWGIYRISEDAGGTIVRHRITAVAPIPAQVHGLALGSGILSTADDSTYYQPGDYLGAYRSAWLTTPAPGAAPAVVRTSRDDLLDGEDGDCSNDWELGLRCVTMFADGTGHHGREDAVWTGRTDLTFLYANGSAGRGPSIDTGDSSPELADLSGRYGVMHGASSRQQYIGDFKAGTVLQERSRVGAAVWGSTLWSAAESGGTVTATKLPGRTAVESFTTGNGCTPSDLQAVGRWVYYVCEDYWGDVHGSGVYDRTAKRTTAAPAGDVLLGDGYLVEHVEVAGLRLVDLAGGKAPRILVTAAELGRFGGPRTSWTVDRFGGGVAYADDEQRVHVVPTGIPAAALTAIDATVATSAAAWSGSWWLSKPAAGWQLVVRNQAGAVLRTVSGSSAPGLLKAAWDGKDATGKAVADGTFTWTLTAQPADGQGAPLTVASPALPKPPAPAALKATTKPAISGTPAVGSTVKASAGTWTPAATGHAYKWAANGVTIKGATKASYAIPPAMLGKRLTVTVTATRSGHPSGTATSASSAVIAKGKASVATRKPAVTGPAEAGKTVRASVGTWSPQVTSYRYEWRLNGKLIKGRTGATLKLTAAMRTKKITVTVIARRTGYLDGKATSKAVTVRK